MIATAAEASLTAGALLREPWRGLFGPLEPALNRVLCLEQLQRLYQEASCPGDAAATLARSLDLLQIGYEIQAGSLDLIPATGPVLVTANHPFGLLEGALLAVLLRRVRPDVRILANSMLASIPDLHGLCIFADLYGERRAVSGNASALKKCLQWLHNGGLLAAFPAGEVSHLQPWTGGVADAPWNPALARLAQRAGAACVPMHFRGGNSMAFHLAGLVHPSLRLFSLPRELWIKRGMKVGVRIGKPVAPATLRAFADGDGAVQHLRRRMDLLAESASAAAPVRTLEPIADAVDPALLESDVATLPADRKLGESGGLTALLGSAVELPNVLREIGRLREISFRAAGEGSGHSRDLDRFDPHYLHLFLWNAATREVAGAYRLAPTPDVLPKFGPRGLYTSTLFRYNRQFFAQMGPAIELGRSFVRPEYQKQYTPLLLLWKGIVRYAAMRPGCHMLFGAASISNAYHPESRRLMVSMLQKHRRNDLARHVSPRNPYRAEAAHVPQEMDQLSKVLADLEPDGKGVPILVKQYLRSGGQVLGFNIDRAFSDSLDALVMVDLRTADPAMRSRIVSESAAKVR